MSSAAKAPYLSDDVRKAFDRWLEAACARWMPPLTFQEVRRGVRAVSSLYLERRAAGRIGPRLAQGRGKRAAFGTYYAALHFLTAYHVVQRLGPARLGAVRRIYDLGCGTGAAGAAVAVALGGDSHARLTTSPVATLRVEASDVAPWVLPEARFTFASFGVSARTSRAALPRSIPRGGPGDLLLLGWVANELADPMRHAVLPSLAAALRRGSRLLLIEPLAGGVSPWWPEWSAALRAASVSDEQMKQEVELPDWIARMDRAAGLDHRTLGARVLAGPLAAPPAGPETRRSASAKRAQ